MESGGLWSEPELHVEARQGSDKKTTEPWDRKPVGPNLSKQLTSYGPDISENIKQDDFFDEDDSE